MTSQVQVCWVWGCFPGRTVYLMSKAHVEVHISVAQGVFVISSPSPNGFLTDAYTNQSTLVLPGKQRAPWGSRASRRLAGDFSHSRGSMISLFHTIYPINRVPPRFCYTRSLLLSKAQATGKCQDIVRHCCMRAQSPSLSPHHGPQPQVPPEHL